MSRETSIEIATLAAYILGQDFEDLLEETPETLVKWLKQLAGSALSQYEAENGEI